jgi:aminoglycoside phosphotransferase (APT) family kinase protein
MTEALRLDEVATFSCPKCLASGAWALTEGPAKRLNSIVAIALCGVCGGRIFIKRLLPSADEDAANRAVREFTTAEALHRAFDADPESGVARPLGQRGAALLFEFVDGEVLSETLRSATRSEQRIASGRIGNWFARFHRVGASGTGPGGFAQKFSAIANHCSADTGLPSTAMAALRHLRDGIPALAARVFNIVHLHGDAKAENFILAGSRVVAVDVDGHFTNIGEMDLAQFLVQLVIAQAGILGRIDEERMHDLEIAFLDGYGRTVAHDPEVLDWMKLYYWLSFWMSTRRRGPIHGMRLNGLFRRRIQACLRNADHCVAKNQIPDPARG